MGDFLVKKFIKNHEQIHDIKVRTAYGVLSSVVGILCNLFLFGVKLFAGIIVNSVSVMADAFNNLSDAASCVIGFVGVKMAEKPADEEHPFGHGRMEYVAALVVAFLVIQVGFTFLKEAIDKLIHPQELGFQWVALAILLLSIGVKLWMCLFNRRLGKKIDSKVMLATAADALGDMITTSTTIVSILVFRFAGINLDGFIGIIVACVVMWAGVNIARDTLVPLIGAAPDPKLCQDITKMIEGYPGIMGTHDLIVHNYGPGRSMASIHAEVSKYENIEKSHELIDEIERAVRDKLDIFLVIHMDPLETKDDEVLRIKHNMIDALDRIDSKCSLHDFRFVDGEERINLIFDLVVPMKYKEAEQTELVRAIKAEAKAMDERYECVITVEKSYLV